MALSSGVLVAVCLCVSMCVCMQKLRVTKRSSSLKVERGFPRPPNLATFAKKWTDPQRAGLRPPVPEGE